MNRADIKADFCLKIDFDKTQSSPDRVFSTMAELIKACHEIDKLLIKSISTKIEPVILLEDVESGSILTWLKVVLEKTDDESLKSGDWKKVIGSYLVESKYFIIDFINNRTKITDKESIEKLQQDLFKLTSDTNIKLLPTYIPINENELIQSIETYNNSLIPLCKTDKAYYSYPKEKTENEFELNTVPFNLEFSFSPEHVIELFVKESITNENTLILTVKKPDYLGDSQWEFRHGKKRIDAKIDDLEWLNKFKNREIDLRPGDALRAKLAITENYDYHNEVTSVVYVIKEVQDVMKLPAYKQTNMFDD